MATYICLFDYTQQGIQNIEQSPARLDSFKEVVDEEGGELKGFYLTMGRHDLVAVLELPDDQTAARVILRLGSLGNVTTETLKAFPEEEFREVIDGLP
ncbi:GYD domain-containing protein [Haladaptatus caseinilyticus]|uniref:GYD domain-containing protein n=1 Tax=Haladaptatus caseinilyticus TaxID=2993314 RepID=UPI00224A7E8E|nr:GYD domain-containing protein [Haladaptatus caseinilyticus]